MYLLIYSSAPVGIVQYLNFTEASPFSSLLTWEPTEFILQNGPIIRYQITTRFTDPFAVVPGLANNFSWINYTNATQILFRELRPEVNFTSTISPVNEIASGPSTSITFSMIEGKYM